MWKNHKEFDCNECKHNYHCDETGEREGSNGPAGFNLISIPGVIESNVCLLPMITERTYYFKRMHKHYKNNLFWVAGGSQDQPNLYLQVMEILGDANTL